MIKMSETADIPKMFINIIIFTLLIHVMSKSFTGDESYFISSKSVN